MKRKGRGRQRHNEEDCKTILISVSISSNLLDQRILLCNADLHHLIACFIAALRNLVPHRKVQRKSWYLDIEIAENNRLGGVFETLSQRHNRSERFIEMENMWLQGDIDDR